MKIIALALFGCFVFAGQKACYAQTWENSPYNWKNSQLNIHSDTGVYDNSGSRIGYETITPSGTKNYYDNEGNRKGYSR